MFRHSQGSFSYTKVDGPVLFADYRCGRVLIVIAAVMLYNYIKQETWRDGLFEKYNDEEMIIIYSNHKDDDDETLTGFMPSQINREMDSFRNNLASLM